MQSPIETYFLTNPRPDNIQTMVIGMVKQDSYALRCKSQ